MHRYTQIVIIQLFTLALILIFPTPPPPPPPPSHTHTHTRTHTPYQKLIWDYKKADLKNIREVFDLVNWERRFGQKDINVQVAPFNETILNVFRDYVPNKYITVEDKDPVLMNETIKSKLQAKKCALKKCLQN